MVRNTPASALSINEAKDAIVVIDLLSKNMVRMCGLETGRTKSQKSKPYGED